MSIYIQSVGKSDGAGTRSRPDRDARHDFRYARDGFVSLRAFAEGSNSVLRETSIRIVSDNFKFLCDAVEDDARRAAQDPKPMVFCPPLATFGNDKTATENDITEGFTVTVECDENQTPRASNLKLFLVRRPQSFEVAASGTMATG